MDPTWHVSPTPSSEDGNIQFLNYFVFWNLDNGQSPKTQ
jgi:hypothetical protein